MLKKLMQEEIHLDYLVSDLLYYHKRLALIFVTKAITGDEIGSFINKTGRKILPSSVDLIQHCSGSL